MITRQSELKTPLGFQSDFLFIMTTNPKGYGKAYYHRVIKPKRNKPKWTTSKSAWVSCAFCGKNSPFKLLTPHEPEVFTYMYGGRGCLKKIPEAELMKDIPKIITEMKKNYIQDIKAMCMRFLYCYCSKEELIAMMNEEGIHLSVQIQTTNQGMSVPYGHAVNMISPINTKMNTNSRISTVSRWED